MFLCICNGTHFSRGQEALVYISNEITSKNQSECIILTSAFKIYFPADLEAEWSCWVRLTVRLADEICLFQQVGANDEVSRLLPTAEGRALPCCWLCLHVRTRKARAAAVGHGRPWDSMSRVGAGQAQQEQPTPFPNLPPKLFSTQTLLSPFPSFPLVGAACPGPASMLCSV